MCVYVQYIWLGICADIFQSEWCTRCAAAFVIVPGTEGTDENVKKEMSTIQEELHDLGEGMLIFPPPSLLSFPPSLTHSHSHYCSL